jgi:hypothetical protein
MVTNNDAGYTNRVREHRFLLKVSHKLSDLDQVGSWVE